LLKPAARKPVGFFTPAVIVVCDDKMSFSVGKSEISSPFTMLL